MTDDRETRRDRRRRESHRESLTAGQRPFTFDFSISRRSPAARVRPDRGDAPGRAEADRARRARPAVRGRPPPRRRPGREPQRAGEAWFQFTVDGRVGNGAGDAVADSAESIEARRVSFARRAAEAQRQIRRWTASLLQVGRQRAGRPALARRGRDARNSRSWRRSCATTEITSRMSRAAHSDPKPQPPDRRQLKVRLINVGATRRRRRRRTRIPLRRKSERFARRLRAAPVGARHRMGVLR